MPRLPDAWDDEEDTARPPALVGTAADNARLWQIANNSLSVASSSLAGSAYGGTSVHAVASSSNPAVPVQAFMPSLKILKRPDKASSNKSHNSEMTAAEKAALAKKNLQDRERAYREARKKIFGNDGKAEANGSSSQPGSGTVSPALPSHAKLGLTPPGSADASESEGAGSGSMSKGKGRRGNKCAGDSSRDSSVTASAASSGRRRTAAPPADANAVTILREPINPPSTSGKSGNELPRGFNTARRQPPKRVLSPAATEFTPRSIAFVAPSPDASRQDGPSPLVQHFDQLSMQASM